MLRTPKLLRRGGLVAERWLACSGTCPRDTRPGLAISVLRHFLGFFWFCYKGSGKSVQYHDTRGANGNADSLRNIPTIFDGGGAPHVSFRCQPLYFLSWYFANASEPLSSLWTPLPSAYHSRVGTGRQKDKAPFRHSSRQIQATSKHIEPLLAVASLTADSQDQSEDQLLKRRFGPYFNNGIYLNT